MSYAMERVFLILVTILTPSSWSQNLDSPCPSIFQYRYDNQHGLYGEISFTVDPTSYLKVDVQMSIGNEVHENGKLVLATPKETIYLLSNHRPLQYYLYFPAWRDIPPKITQILVNDHLICSGPKIPMNIVSILSTVNLQHSLKIDISASNFPSTNNNHILVPPRQDFSTIKDEKPNIDFEYYHIPASKPLEFDPNNKFNFNPTLPPNRFNFNPTTNRLKPSEVYAGNPFFNNNNNNKENTHLSHPPTVQPVPQQTTPPPPGVGVGSPDLSFGDDFELVSKGSEQSTRPYDDVCGRSTPKTIPLIFNGHEVPKGAYPWLVAIFAVKPNGLNYKCAGSLISNRHVVTAAHCVQTSTRRVRPKELLLVLGKLNIQKWIPTSGEKIVEPMGIYVHPDYKISSSDADIALLVLSEPLKFSLVIKPICLWKGDTSLTKIVGNSGTVVGWGRDENGEIRTEEPKQLNVPIVSQETCLASNPKFHYSTSNRTFCAGQRDGTGPCNGDSGGGFIMKKDGKWMLRGIVSLSIPSQETTSEICDLSNYVIFCDVSKFTNWLLSFLK
ncbi:unnamed protein product [Phyllotreta striolata]|uniref:Peptidase S1 domain-containing protein n=1 Tax=Phyllotreta striolata TaxID=444603 RepID=A0A9N9TVU7_PHYSR|nr:unnamed protein product [Phyllotreta striolata]